MKRPRAVHHREVVMIDNLTNELEMTDVDPVEQEDPWGAAEMLTGLNRAKDKTKYIAERMDGRWFGLVTDDCSFCEGGVLTCYGACVVEMTALVLELWPDQALYCESCDGCTWCPNEIHSEGITDDKCPDCGGGRDDGAECAVCEGTGGPPILPKLRAAWKKRFGRRCPLHGLRRTRGVQGSDPKSGQQPAANSRRRK